VVFRLAVKIFGGFAATLPKFGLAAVGCGIGDLSMDGRDVKLDRLVFVNVFTALQ